ncbi:glutathione S-transferase 1-1 [Amyelois transitella]|uniref:glutathione S-transferase 1-1 n=1 Tax=Amyelois transitella TaxID=680683 RepID=UPI00067BEC0C|nr:glutathione S-transferase 1-1 [Amyelois transitella]XP_060802046.1 glutathione S-transferase 1-1 [Amyelois transitella]XP_060802047.1 glutathione S-transferase 1-1 [Amyelois transitella]XP_060802048.1 glutathione S-transferase 1-1 [Amyelois transitella]
MVLKLYAVADGPPSLSVRQALAKLGVPFELVNVDFNAGDHMTPQYALMNPQKEIPVLDDDGFFLSESNAILQYICDKFKPGSPLYPTDPKARAIVNHRLCFNLSTYYANISAYTMAPIFFDYERTPFGLKRVNMALDVFETYMERLGTTHAAGDHLTIADFQLINSTMTLEAVDIDFSKYKRITKWYNDFKSNYPDLWKISADAMNVIQYFAANPPDLSHLNHPIHPARKINK